MHEGETDRCVVAGRKNARAVLHCSLKSTRGIAFSRALHTIPQEATCTSIKHTGLVFDAKRSAVHRRNGIERGSMIKGSVLVDAH